jgi:hypothetical protein
VPTATVALVGVHSVTVKLRVLAEPKRSRMGTVTFWEKPR